MPDGDTGTNMFLTVASVLEELNGVDLGVGSGVRCDFTWIADGCSRNSGWFAEVLRGMTTASLKQMKLMRKY